MNAEAAVAPGTWTLSASLERFEHKDVADGRLLYDHASGTTQLMSPLGRFVVECLAAQTLPVDAADIAQALHNAEPEASAHECLEAVARTLSELLDARLIHAPQN